MYEELKKQLKELGLITEFCGKQRCCDCKNKDLCDKYENKMLSDVYKNAADAIEELSKPRWIPATEQKPKTDDIVIVAIHDDSGDTPYDVKYRRDHEKTPKEE